MSTYVPKENEINPQWFLIDLNEKILGRAATRIADVLMGKNKPQFTPYLDTGDFVIAINAKQVKLTGNKLEDKEYFWHSGYPGGIKSRTAGKLLEGKPEKVLFEAVKGMLPKNALGRQMIKKLKIYADANHPHAAQQPKTI